MSNYCIDIQQEDFLDSHNVSKTRIVALAERILRSHTKAAEITIIFVDLDEISHLNETYRHKSGPTNVLAFPSELPETLALDIPFLGDVVVSMDVLLEESTKLDRSVEAHAMHLIAHGILHLLGYDHQNDLDTKAMQSEEIRYLAELGYPNPYPMEI